VTEAHVRERQLHGRHHSAWRDSNPRPFDHESDAETPEIKIKYRGGGGGDKVPCNFTLDRVKRGPETYDGLAKCFRGHSHAAIRR